MWFLFLDLVALDFKFTEESYFITRICVLESRELELSDFRFRGDFLSLNPISMLNLEASDFEFKEHT